MASISQVDRLLQSVRAQALAGKAGARGLRKPAATSTRGDPKAPDVAVYVAERIRSISADDPQRRKRAFRAFLEGSLLDMFDQAVLEDAVFQGVIDKVHGALLEDPEVLAAMERVVEVLLRGAENGRLETQLGRALRRDKA